MTKNTVLANVKNCLNINFIILSTFGIWPIQHFDITVKSTIWRYFSLFLVGLCLYIFLATEIINFILIFGDIDETIKASFLMLTHAAQAMKTYNILRQRHRVQILVDTLDDPLFNEVDPRSLPRIRSWLLVVKLIPATACVLCFFLILMWTILPFLESDEIVLPLAAWYPFDTRQSPVYELVLAYQMFSTLFNGWYNICLDTFVSGIIAIACVQLDILHDKLADKYLICKRLSPSIDEFQNDRDIRQQLKHCIEHYSQIIRFVDEIERLFGGMVLIQFGASTLIICLTSYKLSKLPMPLEMLSLALYLLLMLAEVLIYCYYGNEIIVKVATSEHMWVLKPGVNGAKVHPLTKRIYLGIFGAKKSQQISDAVYERPWYEYSLANRKLIFTIMERSKRPLNVTAGIFILSLSTFTSILRSSYSYVAVLQQVNADV